MHRKCIIIKRIIEIYKVLSRLTEFEIRSSIDSYVLYWSFKVHARRHVFN